MDRLQNLDLSANNLKIFEYTTLKVLTFLSLSNCLLSKIQFEETLAKDSNLKDLILSHNYLTDAYLKNLTYLLKLNTLDVSFNNITECPPLRNLSVYSIDASGNNISDVRKCAMKDCSISDLHLSRNQIVSWDDPSLFLKDNTRNTSWLNLLDLSFNPIDLFNDEMIHSLDLLQTIDFSRISINCEKCQLYKFQQWFGNTSVEVLPSVEENGPFVCRSPPDLRGMNVLSVTVNPDDCRHTSFNFISAVVIPTALCVSLSVLVILIAYRKRVEIMYMLHLYNQRRSFKKRNLRQCLVNGNEYDAFICFR